VLAFQLWNNDYAQNNTFDGTILRICLKDSGPNKKEVVFIYISHHKSFRVGSALKLYTFFMHRYKLGTEAFLQDFRGMSIYKRLKMIL